MSAWWGRSRQSRRLVSRNCVSPSLFEPSRAEIGRRRHGAEMRRHAYGVRGHPQRYREIVMRRLFILLLALSPTPVAFAQTTGDTLPARRAGQ
jgi:hypothetical protein